MVDLASGKKLSTTVPFGAVVGQAPLKEALLVVGANDDIDGLLVRGEKGTAKSTAVRALADLLPEQRAVADCPYGCPPDDPERQCADCRERADPPVETRPVPLVTLPLGATRERVVGTLSVADALDGDPEFDPGLLARANRGILYVDEVNLLDDHLVDVLLDAAASGVNRVERDGVSVAHPAEFTLVGTMNPEEGDLRPQLRDRFALQATVTGCEDVDDRVEIIDRALNDSWAAADDATADHRQSLLTACDLLDDVALPREFAEEIAELCRDAGVDGHRGDIATARAARTLAALDGRASVIEGDVRRAAELTLPHRLQSKPFEDAPDPEDVVDDHFDDEGEGTESGDENSSVGPDRSEAEDGDGENGADGDSGAGDADDERDGPNEGERGPSDGPDDSDRDSGDDGDTDDENADDGQRPRPAGASDGESRGESGGGGSEGDGGEGDPRNGDDGDAPGDSDDREQGTPLIPGQARAEVGDAVAPDVETPTEATETDDGGSGSRVGLTPSAANEGVRVRTERAESGSVDAAASVRAAAARGGDAVESRDLRQSVRAGESSALVVFALDASASMRGPMRTAKGVALELLRDAYEQRDDVAVVAFAGDDAEVLLPPTDSVTLAARHLKELPVGDRTPLPAGLRTTSEVIARADPATSVVVLVTDGRANASENPTAETRAAASALAGRGAHVVAVDAGGDGRTGLTGDVVEATDGERVRLSALSAERVERAVDRARE
ncbi:VWA domain-containing protein [Halostella sp. JP-L12]|uniref:VWA domain-containing protein n=2 Tax=Halobacteriales TaxID=2235 RepID=UPI000EF82118|nr:MULTISPECIES: VWA domain-containing protein [Halostella]NHN47826.1 VWA domain-containing protein [Halostella sp. JP-L12]